MDQDSPNQWWFMYIKLFIIPLPRLLLFTKMTWGEMYPWQEKEIATWSFKGRLYINMDKWRHLSFSDILASWLRSGARPQKWNVCSVISPMIDLSVSFKTWAICCRKWGNAVARYVLFCDGSWSSDSQKDREDALSNKVCFARPIFLTWM